MIYTEERRATNGYAQYNCKTDMVAAVYVAHHSSYCSRCNLHFNSLEIPRDIPKTTHPTSPTCRDKTVKIVRDVAGPRWTSGVRPDVKMACRVHYVTCHSCSARHRNPPLDYLYTEEKTSDVIEYGALLRLMGDMLQHRYSNHHHR